MWTDIFLENKNFLKETLELFLSDIKQLKYFIEKNQYDEIFNLLKRTKEIREV